MDKNQATRIIRETFESSFDHNKYFRFTRELLNNIEEDPFIYQGNYIPDAFKDYITQYERLGKYNIGENRIDVLVVNLRKETSVERARTMQRNFVAGYLQGKYGSKKRKDAAIVAFVPPDLTDWRFSLVKLDYRFEKTETGRIKVIEEFTPARRWSFLVGANEKSHTAQSQLLPILEKDQVQPTLEDLEKAFSIETVSDEFFRKYRDLFIRTKAELDKLIRKDAKIKADFEGKGVDSVNFAKKLLGQIVFLYFLQKKGWFGVGRDNEWGTGSKNFLRELFEKKHCNYRNFFNDILEPLFYEALRIDRSHDDDFYSRFNCKIPFLNGGLFDPVGNYDWVHTDILLPDDLFSNKHKTPEGDTGDGILDVFDRYNFTVNEEEPLDKEVAIDPELLGKAYERFNAIRQDNFDEYIEALKKGKKEELKFNRDYGVYYTPREIVHYMCRQSLIHYLNTELKESVPLEDIGFFINNCTLLVDNDTVATEKQKKIENGELKSSIYSYKMPESIVKNADTIDRLLAHVTVCDPAVGSGAFPVGLMYETVQARLALNAYLGNGSRTAYNFKRHFIEESLYGVDIDPGAVEIARLRLWLSLVVDEDDFRNIKPLPNLDYKIVKGDSLLGYPYKPPKLEEIEKLEEELVNETRPLIKNDLRKKIDEIIKELLSRAEETLGFKLDFDFKIFFPAVFRNESGFDIVIANPPYIQLQKDGGKLAKLYQSQRFETFARTGDIYCLFYEKGLQILKQGGHLCFITSNKWMRAGYGEKLRNFLTRFNPKLLIDLGPGIFANATVDTNIMLIQKSRPGSDREKTNFQLRAVTLTKDNHGEIEIERQLYERGVVLDKLTHDAWFIGSSAEQQLKEKIERLGKPLKDWNVNIYRGVLTGLNEAFIITTEKRNEILANCKDEDERKRTEAIIKPILRGRDIKRYYYEWAGLWVIGTFPALHLNIEDYPALKKYFLDNFDIRQLEQSGKKYPELGFDARKKTGNQWFETQDQIAYYPEFEKEKVVYSEIVRQPQFYFDIKNFYVEATSFLMTGKNVKYICGLLNSNPVTFFFKQWYAGGGLGEEGYRYKKAFLENLPLPPITPSNQPIVSQIEALVDKILAAKKENPQADTKNLENEIDQLVYKLYNLTPEEIKIIEGGENYED